MDKRRGSPYKSFGRNSGRKRRSIVFEIIFWFFVGALALTIVARILGAVMTGIAEVIYGSGKYDKKKH